MIVTYASEHTWVTEISSDPMHKLGKNNQAKLRSTLNQLSSRAVSHKIVELTPEILAWFVPLYESTIGKKNNPKIKDIYATTIGRTVTYQYFALILEEAGTPIGATIFSKRKSIVSIAYRVYPHQWSAVKLKAQPSLYAEYLINQYSYQCGYTKLSHGKDRNPYGLNASIGLAQYKLSVGCHALLPKTYTKCDLNLDLVTNDILVLEYPQDRQEITKAYLCTNANNIEKYRDLTRYSERLNVKIILRSEGQYPGSGDLLHAHD